MARIIAYPYANSPISEDDCLLGTQKDNGSTNQSNPTKNFSVGNVVTAGLGYTAYTALISQSGVNNPAVTEIQNKTGSTFTWARTGPGTYTVTSSVNLNFTGGKTIVFINYGNPSSDGLPPKWSITSDTIITIKTQDETGVLDDDLLASGAFEIRIYS
jgi:hypothetical protein